MKRGTESIVRLGKGVEPADFSGINVLSTVILGKKESATKDFNGLFITDAVMLGKKISHAAVVTATVHGVSPLSLQKAVADSLQYVKAFGGSELQPEEYIDSVTALGKTEQRNLPKGYMELEYIQSSGTQYIDTGYKPNNNTKIDITVSFASVANGHIFGSRMTNTGGAGFAVATITNIFTFDYNGDRVYGTPATVDTVYRIVKNGAENQISYGTTVNTYSNSESTFSVDATMALFGINTANTIACSAASIKIYSTQIEESGVMVRDFVPARRNSDNVLGMYDTVSGQFFTNQGTGDFTAGADVVPTPDTPMDIVSNNGVLKASINEFDANAITNGYFYNADLEWVENSSVCTTDYMKTVKGKYTLVLGNVTTLSATVNVRVNLFNANKEIQSQTVIPITVDTTEYTYEVDIPDGISYVRVSTNPMYVVVSGFSNSKTVYTDGTVETIKDSLNNTATAEILLKVGDYQDTQSILDGVITRNVGVFVLDGTENWQNGSGTYATNCFCDNLLPNLKRPEEGNSPAICTAFPMVERISDFSAGKGYVSSNPARRVNLWYNDTAANFKQYLADQYAAGTPVIVLYPLATPTTESVAGQTMQVQQGDNVVEITQASMTGLELEAKYQKRE